MDGRLTLGREPAAQRSPMGLSFSAVSSDRKGLGPHEATKSEVSSPSDRLPAERGKRCTSQVPVAIRVRLRGESQFLSSLRRVPGSRDWKPETQKLKARELRLREMLEKIPRPFQIHRRKRFQPARCRLIAG